MDEMRFDGITMAFGAPTARRGVLGLLAALGSGRVLLNVTTVKAKNTKKNKGKKKKKKRPTPRPPQPSCRFEAGCSRRFALGRCCPGPAGLDFCFASEDDDPCPAACTGYDCPCLVDDDCPTFDGDDGLPERGFCCKNCGYYGDPEFGTCLPPGSDLECTRCGQTPAACGSDSLHECYPDEACCLNAGGTKGICCPDASQCSIGPNDGLPCCNEPGCLGVGEYKPPDALCCCGIFDSGSHGGGQVCCTRERGQSCGSSAECCPDFQGDTVCRNGVCTLPGATGSDDDCPPARPFWCPPQSGSPGYCTNLKTSRNNCSACRVACLPAQLCLDGTCG